MGTLKLVKKDPVPLKIHDEFLNNLISKHTRLNYRKFLEAFFYFIAKRYPAVSEYKDIDRDMIVKYRNEVEQIGGRNGEQGTPNTIVTTLSAITSYFNYLVKEKKLLTSNPASTVSRPRLEVVHPTRSLESMEQVEELFNSVDSKESGPLHLALLASLWLTGLRKGEILDLKRSDYYKEHGDAVLQYKGKGGKFRVKLVHVRLEIILDSYLLWMKENGREHIKEDWLFQPTKNPRDPKNLNKRINERTLNRIVDKYAKKIGIEYNVSPHSARATFITILLEEEVPIIDVAREVAHSSIKTTQRYDKRRIGLDKSLVRRLPI